MSTPPASETGQAHRLPETMTALVAAGVGWQQRELPVPAPHATQVLVRARAVALNNADLDSLSSATSTGDAPQGDGSAEDTNATPVGYEFAGEIVAVGEQVTGVSIGDRVMGTTPGSFAQYVPVDHRHVIPVPDGVSDTDACALPTGLLTEHGALVLAGFRSGQSVLVSGASSGIGLLGVQIARALGASPVIATTREAAKTDLLRGLGATHVVTSSGELVAAVLEATSRDGVDVVLDHVGGAALAGCLPATRTGGTLVSIGRLSGDESSIDLARLESGQLTLRGVSFGFTPPEQIGDVLAGLTHDVLPALADGRISAVVDTVLDFDDSAAALGALRGHRTGKVVLRVP
ncbi:zinc-binding alcohol dehydrogenase family protein [uncultured Jatrophihabitans sp.]|uniref:quinone oxidoreductase family protein n=1 Tax=uncultured Jatrophihabitans sp. TaxID=1610747 RepID=UPI0035CC472D